MTDTWREVCRCGAAFEYPTAYGMYELEQWRRNHRCDVLLDEPATPSSTADEGRPMTSGQWWNNTIMGTVCACCGHPRGSHFAGYKSTSWMPITPFKSPTESP